MTGTRILVVEDERIIAEDIKRSVRRLGHDVTGIVPSADAALAAVERDRPDLVFMDIHIRGERDGIETAAEIRKKHGIPVVYLTAFADSETLDRAKLTEPFGYLIKPFEDKELETVIEIAMYRHAMDRQLRENRQWLHEILRSIEVGLMALDGEKVIRLWNPVVAELTGISEDESVGRAFDEVLHFEGPGEWGRIETPSTALLAGRKLCDSDDPTILVTRDGERIEVAEHASPIRNDEGESLGSLVIIEDIRERRRLERQVLRSQKLESVGILAGGIAHDFNNLLVVILGNVSLAKMRVEPASPAHEMLDKAERAALQTVNLTKQFLTFAKGGAPVKKAASIGELVRETVEFAVHGGRVLPDVELPDDLWDVEMDTGQISQVVHNLVLNAAQAMPDGGALKVRAENVEVPANSGLDVAAGSYVRVSVEDEGLGIPERHLGKVFDPYFTTKTEGCGLGLTTAYSILRKHQGTIDVSSRLGEGTRFTFHLPAAVTKEGPRRSRVAQLWKGRGRMLVLDDEEQVRSVAATLLRTLGFEVDLAEDGDEAIELVRLAQGGGKPYRAAILDLTVPGGMGGREALLQIRKISPEIVAIVSSGYSNDAVMARPAEHGFDGVIAKPYTLQELSARLKSLLEVAAQDAE